MRLSSLPPPLLSACLRTHRPLILDKPNMKEMSLDAPCQHGRCSACAASARRDIPGSSPSSLGGMFCHRDLLHNAPHIPARPKRPRRSSVRSISWPRCAPVPNPADTDALFCRLLKSPSSNSIPVLQAVNLSARDKLRATLRRPSWRSQMATAVLALAVLVIKLALIFCRLMWKPPFTSKGLLQDANLSAREKQRLDYQRQVYQLAKQRKDTEAALQRNDDYRMPQSYDPEGGAGNKRFEVLTQRFR